MRILVVAPSWIGDTIMAQPLLARLRAAHPTARIDVFAPPWVAPVLSRMAEVDSVLDNPFAHGQFRWRARRALARGLKAQTPLWRRSATTVVSTHAEGGDFDLAYVLPNSWKSALVPFFADVPRRVGYQGEARWGLLTERHRLDTQRHPRLVQRYAALAGPLDATPLPDPHIAATPAQQAATRAALGLPADAAPVVFCPGAEFGPAKRWPEAHYAALAQHVAASRGAASADDEAPPVWLIGSKKDAPVGEAIAQLAGGAALNLCGRSSLDQAVDLIAGARAAVCNDSGLMHVAAALGVPLVALFGSSSPDYTPPLSPRARIVSRRLACSPCFKRECPLGHFDCLQGLPPATVADALDSLVAGAAA